MSRYFKTTILFTLLTLFVHANELDNYKMMTETYPPYNMKVDGKLQGISIDLWSKMLKMVGSQKTREDIELLPWARAYATVQEKPKTALFAMFRTDGREEMFKWVGPLDSSIIGLITRKDRNIKINSFDELNHYRIGTVKDDVAELLLIEKGYDKKKLDSLSGTNSIEKSVRKLNHGRIDMFSYIANINEWNLKIKDFDPNNYEVAYVLQEQQLYFALHKDSSDAIVNSLQKALDELKSNGFYDSVIKKYK